jgi:putative peptidoglycan lipid II flippase
VSDLSAGSFRSSAGVSLLTGVALIASFGVQLVAASAIGAGAELDAYYVALTVPTVVVGLVTSTLAGALVPVFSALLASGNVVAAWSTAVRTFAFSVCALIVLSATGVVTAVPVLRLTAPGLGPSSLQQAVDLATLLWPATAIAGCATVLGALHQGRRRFLQAAAGPVVGNLITLVVAFSLVGAAGIRGLALGALVGAFGQLGILAVRAFPAPARLQMLAIRGLGRVRQVAKLWAPLVVGGIVFQSLVIFDRFLASALPAGSVTYLALAQRTVGVLATVVTTGAVSVGVVTMSSHLASGNTSEFRKTLTNSLSTLFLLVLPLVAIFWVVREPFVAALFERGRFDANDTTALSNTFAFYLLALPGISLGGVVGAAYYALQDTKTPTVLGIAGVLLYFVYMPLVARAFGVEGIAAGIGVYYTYQFLVVAIALWLKLGRPDLGRAALRSGCAALAALAAAAAAAASVALVPTMPWGMVVGVVLGGAGYLLALSVLSPNEVLTRTVWRTLTLGRREAWHDQSSQ